MVAPLDEQQQHPVEVVARIRAGRDGSSSMQVLPSGVRVANLEAGKARDFQLDGVSCDGYLRDFYSKHVSKKVEDVRGGGVSTILMYGPTGSGKTYTMFGYVGEQGIVYCALREILQGDGGASGLVVKATVIEIFNEEVYDLLSRNSVASPSPKHFKASARPRLEIRGGKVRNATCITSVDASMLARHIEMVERMRAVRSTNCNERSSRSHCVVILDVLPVGGSLMLVDMAGSENLEQAGLCADQKIQTGKINQGNGALKRVVEAIANHDSYIPYRDSKLTMMLQDTFRDYKSKILMILCISPDSRDLHRAISTLAKIKTEREVGSNKPIDELLKLCDEKDKEILSLRKLHEENDREKCVLAKVGSYLTIENMQCLEMSLLKIRIALAEQQLNTALSSLKTSPVVELVTPTSTQMAEEAEAVLSVTLVADVVATTPRIETISGSSLKESSVPGNDTPEISSTKPTSTTPLKTECEVFVKWESSAGEFICIVNIVKGASLEELRREISPKVPYLKQEFQFLLIGEDGAPVDKPLEPSLRVLSLPACKNNFGSRLAILRAPITRSFRKQPTILPFKPLENADLKQESKNATKPLKHLDALRPQKISLKERATVAYVNSLTSKFQI